MKRKISFGIAVLMILATCLFVSCNSEVSTTAQVNDGKLVYATFDKSSKAIRPSSSSMTISYELDNINDLYWVYTATKTDGAGTTGQTDGKRVPGNAEWKGLGGTIGAFSKGTWTFTVEGYKYIGEGSVTSNPTVADLRNTGVGHQFDLIYVGTADGVVLNVTNTEDNPSTIDITVYLQTQGGTGTLKIAKDSKFFWAASGEGGYALTDLKLKVYDGETLISGDGIALTGNASEGTGHAVYYSNANDTNINNLNSGDHVFKVQIVRNVGGADQVFFEGTVNAKIYAGITTALDTQAIEGLFTYAQFNGTIDDSAVAVVVVASASKEVTQTQAGSVSFETDYTPASGINPSSSNEKTTVAIDSTVIENNTTYNLGVETSNIIAAGSKFSVASDSTAVASVDLTLTKTEGSTTTTVSDFGAGAATVTTYIAKNLTDVKFFYENTPFTKVETEGELGVDKFYYEGSTGKLVFMTSHFSEFYVTSTDKVYDNQTNTCYTLEAFNNIEDVTAIAHHDLLLLDAAVANSIDDSRDVFNAGFKWAVIHTPSDLPNTTDFAGGYGTKIEPFLIADATTFQKISTKFADGYCYYMIKSGVTQIDCSHWVPVNLYGSFNGNNATLNNLDESLFRMVGPEGNNTDLESWNQKDVAIKNFNVDFKTEGTIDSATGLVKNLYGSNKTTFENIHTTGTLISGSNGAVFFCFTSGNDSGNNPDHSWATVPNGFMQEIYVNNCTVATTIYAPSNSVGIVGGHYCAIPNNLKVVVNNVDSIFTGNFYSLSGKYRIMAGCAYGAIDGSTPLDLEKSCTKITEATVSKGGEHYITTVNSADVSKIKVFIAAQLSKTGTALQGITMSLKEYSTQEITSTGVYNVLPVFTSVDYRTNQDDFDAYIENSVLVAKIGGTTAYDYGTIKLVVIQYKADGSLVAAKTHVVAAKENASSGWDIK